MPGLDPFKLTEEVYKKVARFNKGFEERRYYRFRGGKWYGGIATGDVVGCNLRCKFCWSWRYSYYTDKGEFYNPLQVFEKVYGIAREKGYRYVRLSGGEPTISWRHLIELVKLIDETDKVFILETNGLLIGRNENYAKELANHANIVVRVSFKGVSPEEFEMLTGADRSFFQYQFKALENLLNAGLRPGEDFYPAVMLSFSDQAGYTRFKSQLAKIHPKLVDSIDEEYVILYPHVVELLKRNNLKPKVAYRPDGIPDFMI
ncbi:radical SAM protein [Thermogladius sp. 4427co]|uniref:radical SAM protein n=1 Tax=Thermogladius sp. 4427co TaxID=3450718 RepID=UPI003F79922E